MMITRIVRMYFTPGGAVSFLALFAARQQMIRTYPGCRSLHLWQDAEDRNCFMTYSEWHDAEALAQYRQSDLFREVWAQTKVHFRKRPEAFSAVEAQFLLRQGEGADQRHP